MMVILFGLAGSGKSTQGQILAKKYDMEWLSVGQVLRETGKFDATLEKGELVDDDVVIKIMKAKIESVKKYGKDIILDGFPRDKYQARWVVENLAEEIETAVVLEVPKDELMVRIMARGREDDTRGVIEKRFRVVEQNIYSILYLLEKGGVRIRTISGSGEITTVTRRLERVLFGEKRNRLTRRRMSLSKRRK